MLPSELKNIFTNTFGKAGGKVSAFQAPGRVNLIGEHTDYNNGYVLPCALSFGTTLLIRENNKDYMRFVSLNFSYRPEIRLEDLHKKHENHWINYPLGVINEFLDRNISLKGLDMLFYGDIPVGAGLSSSASIEMVTAVALNDMLHAGIGMTELVKMSKKAENEFVGVSCGIMDQFIAGLGKRDHALFLDCKILQYEQVPFQLRDESLVIINTKKGRELAASKYNERVEECNKAVSYLNKKLNIKSLGDLSVEEFNENKGLIRDETASRRARHVVSENERVLKAVQALKSSDIEGFGRLMTASHESLKNDYEVSGPELDILAEAAMEFDGTLGARMTGAGFGGCTVNIVKSNVVSDFKEHVKGIYQQRTSMRPEFYVPDISDGAGKIFD